MKTIGLIAKKIGMTRVVEDNGNIVPVTLLSVENTRITKILTPERDGYHGVQLGYHEKTEKHINKPDMNRLKKANIEGLFTQFREYSLDAPVEGVELNKQIGVDMLGEIESLDVTGLSKGKGFQGAVKRWGAKIGRMTHGSHFHRSPGSLGQRSTPGRVFKNKHMPGQTGNKRKTIQNLKIVDIDAQAGTIAVKGSVPGHRQGYLFLKPSVKIKAKKKQ